MKPFSLLIGSTTFVVTALFPLSAFAEYPYSEGYYYLEEDISELEEELYSGNYSFDNEEFQRFKSFYESQDESSNVEYEFQSFEQMNDYLSRIGFGELIIEEAEQTQGVVEQSEEIVKQPEATYSTSYAPISYYKTSSSSSSTQSSSSTKNSVLKKFLQGAEDLKNGKPKITYVYGGTITPTANRTGQLDCSSFTQYVYKKYFNVTLQRTTGAQYSDKRAQKVSVNNLKPGDLVFNNGKGHVGIYLGNGKVLHNSSKAKKPVIVSLKQFRPQQAVRYNSVSKKLNTKKSTSQNQRTTRNNNQTKNNNQKTKNNNETSKNQKQTNKNQTNKNQTNKTKQNQTKENNTKNKEKEPVLISKDQINFAPFD